MLLKEIGRKIAQAFRLARAADEKVASSIAAALDAKAEQIKEYEKRFEPEHPEPEPLPMQQVIQSLATYGFSTDEAACAIAKAMAPKPKLLRNLTNNWRKMHGLPMHRKPASFEQTGRMKIRHCMNGTTWTAHVQPWTNTRSRRRRRENNGRS